MKPSGVIKVLVGDNCQPCEILKNRINKMIADKEIADKDVQILHIEREGRSLAIKYKVMSVPAMLSQSDVLSGVVSPDKILRFIRNGRL